MIQQYVRAAIRRAHYEFIEDNEPFYGGIPELAGMWASAETLEECRDRLRQALEDWLVFSLVNGFEIPALDDLEFP